MAGTGTNAGNIIISAVNVKWRIESRALVDVSAESDPDGTYFDLFDTDGATAESGMISTLRLLLRLRQQAVD